jgi:hypothetical protein
LLEARARLALANALRILDRYDEAISALERAESVLAGHDRPELLAASGLCAATSISRAASSRPA